MGTRLGARLFAVALAFGVFFGPHSLLAQPQTLAEVERRPTPPGGYLHDGFFGRAALGISHLRLWRSARPSTDFGGNVDESLSSGAVSLVYALGGTPAPGLVIGVASFTQMGTTRASSHGLRVDGRAQKPYAYGSIAAVMLGPFVDFYPDPTAGWHLVGTVGFGLVGVEGGFRSTPTAPNGWGDRVIEEVDGASAHGGGLSVGGGYEFWAARQLSLGAIVEVGTIVAPRSTSRLPRERWSGIALLGPSFTFNITYH